jgi:CBS domain-containing protein
MTQVIEVMTSPVIELRKDTTLCEATTLMSKKGISGAPVVDEEDHLVGILSESDILEFAASKEGVGLEVRTLSFVSIPYERIVRDEELCRRYQKVGDTKVADAMNDEVVTIDANDTVETALDTMVRLNFNRLPVTKNGKLVGMIARQDVLASLCREISGQRPTWCPTVMR